MYLWRWKDGAEPKKIALNSSRPALGLAFSPDGKALVYCDGGSTIRLMDTTTEELIRKFKGPENWQCYNDLLISPDGKFAAARGPVPVKTRSGYEDSSQLLLVWDLATGKRVHRFISTKTFPEGLVISPDSRLIAAGDNAGLVRIWELATGRRIGAHPEAHESYVNLIACSSDGKTVVTASGDHTVRVWDPITGRQEHRLEHDSEVRALAVSPDGQYAVSSGWDNTVRVWDTQTGRELHALPGHGTGGSWRAVGFLDGGRRFASWGDDMTLRLRETRSGKLLSESVLPPELAGPEGFDKPRKSTGKGKKNEFRSQRGAFSADGRTFALKFQGTTYIYETETGRELGRFKKRSNELIRHMAVSPDGKLLLTTGDLTGRDLASAPDIHITLRELPTGEELRRFVIPDAETKAGPVAFSSDGRLMATGLHHPHDSVLIWDVRTRKEVLTIDGVRGNPGSLAFSDDGRRLACGLNNTTALVWDLTRLMPKE